MMLINVQAELDRVQADMTEQQAAAWVEQFRADYTEANREAWRKLVVDRPTLRRPEPAVMTGQQLNDLQADARALEPATGRHDARDSVRLAAATGKLSHRTDRAARRGLCGRGQR